MVVFTVSDNVDSHRFFYIMPLLWRPRRCVWGGIFLKGVLSKQKIYVGYEIIIQK